MTKLKQTKTLVAAALMTAFTCIATMVIQIPTPTLGYIHPGDCLVLLCGVILGPGLGALAAGIGSMFADLLSGYVVYAIPTLIIKGLTACIAGFIFSKMYNHFKKNQYISFLLAGILAEINMIIGYFIHAFIQAMMLADVYTNETFAAALTNAASGIFTNTIQGTTGVVLGLALIPLLLKVPDIRTWIQGYGSEVKTQPDMLK